MRSIIRLAKCANFGTLLQDIFRSKPKLPSGGAISLLPLPQLRPTIQPLANLALEAAIGWIVELWRPAPPGNNLVRKKPPVCRDRIHGEIRTDSAQKDLIGKRKSKQENLYVRRHLLARIIRKRRQARRLGLQQLLDRICDGRIAVDKPHRPWRSLSCIAEL